MEAEIHHHFRVLVTSREMDWYNFSGDISNIQSIRIIKPDLSKDDAKEIFCKLKIMKSDVPAKLIVIAEEQRRFLAA